MSTSTAAPSRTSAANESWSLLTRLFLRQRPWFMAVCAEFDLTPGQLQALKALDPAEPVPMRNLAEALACDNSNVTGIVDRLEERGLVERRTAPHDRRVKMLVVTPGGADLRAAIVRRMQEAPEPLRRLSADEQRRLCELVRKALDD